MDDIVRETRTGRKGKKKGASLNSYHSVAQLRIEGWNELHRNAVRLADAVEQGADPSEIREKVAEGLALLEPIDSYWAYPSRHDFLRLHELFSRGGDYVALRKLVTRHRRALGSRSYQHARAVSETDDLSDAGESSDAWELQTEAQASQPYFEVLVVADISPQEEEVFKARMRKLRRPEDKFIFEMLVVPSFEDALIAVLFNYNIQAVLIRYGFPFKSQHELDVLRQLLSDVEVPDQEDLPVAQYGPVLGAKIAELRPELDLYLITDVAVEEIAGRLTSNFRRIFYRLEDYTELYLSIQRGVNERYQTPFFNALKEYSRQPTGVFHALPISRGKSIVNSNWIQDMVQFYGLNIFMAETSATSGGLDSLLEPTGPIKRAQQLAARAFGARQTFFVTNGTSTGNKIVVQALIEPGDVVLVDRNCHKSHHYGMVLAGAHVAYLDSYPLHEYSMYGAVPLAHIKSTLLKYKRAGTLERVKMLLLTNCTFDGMIYDVERVMQECLAIKPDLIFLWDEAWFAFARFHPTYRRRTAMWCADQLRTRYRSAGYKEQYAAWRDGFEKMDQNDDETWIKTKLMPDPSKVRIRTYATQSTHKRLTALRQGSMIHVYDQDFKHKVEDAFHEAYMTHTSTSPNYQILASLDVGRRQVELEGFELVQKQTDLAMALREAVAKHPLLSKYFRFLTIEDVIPADYRPSGMEFYYSRDKGWARMETAWRSDEFVLDPSHLTLYIGATGMDGDTFKHEQLMDKFGIQINKTTRNTNLFMTNIGTSRSSIAYLIEVLVKIAREIDENREEMSRTEQRLLQKKIVSLTQENPPLPNFSYFHEFFRPDSSKGTPDGDLRKAFFMSYKDELCEYLTMPAMREHVAAGREVVSAMFVIPYPPGFPILVPGQVISEEILEFMRALDTKEIHGYRPALGFRVFTESAMGAAPTALPADVPRARKADVHTAPVEVAVERSDALHKAPQAR